MNRWCMMSCEDRGPGRDLRDHVRWPYPFWTYALRVVWHVVWRTLWQVCWRRVLFLRPLILRLFGARAALSVGISRSVWIEMPWDVSLGERSSLGPGVTLYNLGGVNIGDFAVLSQDVYLCGGTHDYTDPTYPLVRQKIVIGRYAWVAAGAFIGPGVTVGEGAVVGARAVVTKDVEPWTVVAGNPARFVKRRELKGISPPADAPAAGDSAANHVSVSLGSWGPCGPSGQDRRGG